jgi:hypothetical protein
MPKTKFLMAASVAATVALTACSSEPETITVNQFDAQADALANAAPVEAPPMIQASRTYRCRDNSLVYIDFLSNNTANIRNERGGEIVATATAPGGTPPYTAEGYSVSANADQVSYTSPAGTKSCRSGPAQG